MIIEMHKITFVGLEAQRDSFVQRLQEVGVAHLILPTEALEPMDLAKELTRVSETRKFLSSKQAQAAPKEDLNALEVCDRREALSQREARIQTEMVALKKEFALQEPWGDFNPKDIALLRERGLVIQFFRVPQKVFESLQLKDIFHVVISSTRGEVCFITLSFSPVSLGISEEKLPTKSLTELKEDLGRKRQELVQIDNEYKLLASYLNVVTEKEAELIDKVAYRRAILNAQEEFDGKIFVLSCWSPLPEAELLKQIGDGFTLYHFSEKAKKEERVPVLLKNKPAFESGEDLVKVYSYPSYQDFDPSGFVLYCFAVFFGMILGDAGYGLVLLALTILINIKVKTRSPFIVRFLRLMYLLSIATVLTGVLSAGYFGVSLSPENPLSKITLMDFNSKEGQNQIMILSIIFGMIHISMALLIKFKNTRDIAALAWIPVMWGGFFLVKSRMGAGIDNPPAKYVLIAGLILVLLFSSSRRNILIRLLEGLNGLLGIVQVFSDVLSYLRLFALGIATVYMAQTFNMLAEDIIKSVPYLGYILGGLVLFAGHGVNLLLGVMGGVIHGLRLNFLEWYRWCFVGDGVVYKPFRLIKSGK
jgi:V/A-type H+-transporting ATPase subunit I